MVRLVLFRSAQQRIRAQQLIVWGQVDQHHHIGMSGNGRQRFGRVRHQRLAMHFIGKELVEDRPALFPLHRAAAGPVAKAVEEIVPFQLERSEEHTSELQSLMRISYAVFCLKKKKQKQRTNSML